jgi:hypothetical protein
MYTMGGLMLLLWVLRFFVFHLYESPKYLMGRGRDAEAVEVVHKVARYNGTTSGLTLEMLTDAGNVAGRDPTNVTFDTSAKAAALRKLQNFGGGHVKPLFATKKLAYSTSLLIVLWGEWAAMITCPTLMEVDQHSLALLSLCKSPTRTLVTVKQADRFVGIMALLRSCEFICMRPLLLFIYQ